MNPLNILMAQSDRFFKNNQKDPAPPAALLSFSFMSSIQIVPGQTQLCITVLFFCFSVSIIFIFLETIW